MATFEDYLKSQGYNVRSRDDESFRVIDQEGEYMQSRDLYPFLNQYYEATKYSSPEIYGSAGMPNLSGTEPTRFGFRFNGESGYERPGDGPLMVNIGGQNYLRTRTADNSRFDPFGGGYFYDPTYGWVVDPQIAKSYSLSNEDFFDTYGVALAGAGLAAGPMAASMAAGGAGTAGAGTTAGSGTNFLGSLGNAFRPETLNLSNMTIGGASNGIGTGLGTFGTGTGAGAAASSAVGGGVDFLSSLGSLGFDAPSWGSFMGDTFGASNLLGGSQNLLGAGTNFGWESFMPGGNLTGMGAGAPTGTAGGSIWDTILRQGGSAIKNMFAPKEEQSQVDTGKLLMALASLFTGNKYADELQKLMQQQDPFGPQRPFYQDVLKQSYTDPNFLQNNPTFQAMLNPAMQETKARMAARGLNSSGNALHELMRTGTETAAKFMLPFQAQTGQFAGSGIDPRTAGLLGLQSANANNQAMGNIGVALNEIWKTLNKGPEIMY